MTLLPWEPARWPMRSSRPCNRAHAVVIGFRPMGQDIHLVCVTLILNRCAGRIWQSYAGRFSMTRRQAKAGIKSDRQAVSNR